jgi:hypothetical protein
MPPAPAIPIVRRRRERSARQARRSRLAQPERAALAATARARAQAVEGGVRGAVCEPAAPPGLAHRLKQLGAMACWVRRPVVAEETLST